jgi:hypothetical protein
MSIAVVEPAKNQLLRDFRRRSVFDFCNTIGTFRKCRNVQLESRMRTILLQKFFASPIANSPGRMFGDRIRLKC